ncbi:hypothetical protein H920_02035 [Fukomys damarensis]|uniref:Uncharacterized protein n=1 Tax=Fukomys damarensis TaxID=885580 RepID=A0A091ELV8_FUKDA|nr:hypothetical protein H920_02035 [Fukomys damarensis]
MGRSLALRPCGGASPTLALRTLPRWWPCPLGSAMNFISVLMLLGLRCAPPESITGRVVAFDAPAWLTEGRHAATVRCAAAPTPWLALCLLRVAGPGKGHNCASAGRFPLSVDIEPVYATYTYEFAGEQAARKSEDRASPSVPVTPSLWHAGERRTEGPDAVRLPGAKGRSTNQNAHEVGDRAVVGGLVQLGQQSGPLPAPSLPSPPRVVS